MLFASVQYLLLTGADSPLANYYATITSTPIAPDEGAVAAFGAFCLDHDAAIRDLLRSRLVQTNEVGRSAVLLPAFALVARLAGGAPLALIDVGAAAGLNLLFDRFHFDYARQSWGDPSSPVQLTAELRGNVALPFEPGLPIVGYRVGVDLAPIDLTDPDAVLWLRALVWPEQPQRATVLTAAAGLVRRDLPLVVRGDASVLLPDLIAGVPAGLAIIVYHSFALQQFPLDTRAAFDSALAEASHRQPVYSIELTGGVQQSFVRLTLQRDSETSTVQLAECGAHGQWLRWLSDEERERSRT